MLRTGLLAAALILTTTTGCALQQGRTTFLKPSAVSPIRAQTGHHPSPAPLPPA